MTLMTHENSKELLENIWKRRAQASISMTSHERPVALYPFSSRRKLQIVQFEWETIKSLHKVAYWLMFSSKAHKLQAEKICVWK